MSSKTQQPILHHAEEFGQSRAYDKTEAVGLFVLAVLTGLWVGLSVMVVGAAYLLYTERGFWTAFFVLAGPAGVLAGGGAVLAKGIHEQLDGLRTWREATSYAPPQPQPQSEPVHPPILVKPYKGEPYALIEGAGRPALPGREEALRITPTVVIEVLRASIEEYGGEWSRRKLMALRIQGQKVSRGVYEELTAWLARAGVLQQTRQGGFVLPPDVQDFDDLQTYFPNLSSWEGRDGNREGRERGGDGDTQPASGEVTTLAERRQREWLECGCDVVAYLERRGNHD